jgi:hypothetical protein
MVGAVNTTSGKSGLAKGFDWKSVPVGEGLLLKPRPR